VTLGTGRSISLLQHCIHLLPSPLPLNSYFYCLRNYATRRRVITGYIISHGPHLPDIEHHASSHLISCQGEAGPTSVTSCLSFHRPILQSRCPHARVAVRQIQTRSNIFKPSVHHHSNTAYHQTRGRPWDGLRTSPLASLHNHTHVTPAATTVCLVCTTATRTAGMIQRPRTG